MTVSATVPAIPPPTETKEASLRQFRRECREEESRRMCCWRLVHDERSSWGMSVIDEDRYRLEVEDRRDANRHSEVIFLYSGRKIYHIKFILIAFCIQLEWARARDIFTSSGNSFNLHRYTIISFFIKSKTRTFSKTFPITLFSMHGDLPQRLRRGSSSLSIAPDLPFAYHTESVRVMARQQQTIPK